MATPEAPEHLGPSPNSDGDQQPTNQPEKLDAAVLKVAGAVVLGMIMVILDITVVNVALPTFQRVFDVDSYATVAWTVTAYTLALAVVIPVTGWAADRFGTKRLYVTALALFTIGSVLCATAWNIQALIGFRVVQGLGGGMLMPLGMTIMTKVAGPGVAALRCVQHSRRRHRVGHRGAAHHGHRPGPGGGVRGLLVQAQKPLLDLRLFKNYDLAVSIVTLFLFGVAFFGSLLLVPTYFISVRGESTLTTGLLVSAQGIGAVVTMPLAGALIDRMPVGRIIPVGMVAVFLGLLGLTQVGPDTSYIFLLACLFVLGLGMGGAMMPLFTAALRTLKPHEVARGSSLINIVQQVASSAGAAIISMVYASRLADSPAVGASQAIGQAQQNGQPAPDWAQQIAAQLGQSFQAVVTMDMSSAFAVAFWVSVGLIVVTGGVSLLLPKKPADEHVQEIASREGTS